MFSFLAIRRGGTGFETNLPPANTNQLTLPIFGTPTVQSGPAPATGYPGMTAAPPLAGTTQLAGAPPVTQLPPVPLLRLGPVILHPHLDYNVSYGNSLQPLPGQQVNTVVNSISPGIFLGLGIIGVWITPQPCVTTPAAGSRTAWTTL